MATRLHVWDGSKFVPAKEILVWNGSSWSPTREGYFWDGSKWVPIIEYRRWFYESGTEHVPWAVYTQSPGASLSKNDTHLYLYAYVSAQFPFGGVSTAGYRTAVAVDLSELSTLYVDWSFSISYDGNAGLGVVSAATGNTVRSITRSSSFSRRVDALDVSTLRKDVHYYLSVWCSAYSSISRSASVTLRAYNIYAE